MPDGIWLHTEGARVGFHLRGYRFQGFEVLKLRFNPAKFLGREESERYWYPSPEVPVVEVGRAPE